MKPNSLFAFVLVLGSAVSGNAGAAQSKTPTQAYLDYHAALVKAQALEEILPFLSAAYRGMLESRPKQDRPTWLKRLQDGALKEVKITRETIEGDKCTLEGTGTSARGNAMKGKVHLVREGGAWKIDEEGWST